jgi:hypothetical protein
LVAVTDHSLILIFPPYTPFLSDDEIPVVTSCHDPTIYRYHLILTIGLLSSVSHVNFITWPTWTAAVGSLVKETLVFGTEKI